MAGSVNKAILIGNLGRDPEIRDAGHSGKVANLAVATSESWKDKNTGEKQERTEWHRVSVFGKIAEYIGQYCSKGSQIYIEGQIRTRKWTDKDGQEKYTTEIVVSGFDGKVTFLSPPKGSGAGAAPQAQSGGDPFASERKAAASKDDWRDQGGSINDEIPFGPEVR